MSEQEHGEVRWVPEEQYRSRVGAEIAENLNASTGYDMFDPDDFYLDNDPEVYAEMRTMPAPEPDEARSTEEEWRQTDQLCRDYDLQAEQAAYSPDDVADERMPRRLEYADGTGDYPLFEGVQIIEDDNGLRFRTPRRIIRTKDGAVWGLSVFGSLKHFKERDDYGFIRSLADEQGMPIGAIWKPHLYPWEEVGEDGLPLIRDRERCEITVELADLNEARAHGAQVEIAITTPSGRYQAQPDQGLSYNPRGDQYFEEFVDMQRRQIADVVEYPNAIGEPPSLSALLLKLYDAGEFERADRIEMGEEPLPPELTEYDRPNDWQVREPFITKSLASGTMWVPIDLLRSGAIEAAISFPSMQPRLQRQVRGVTTLEELVGQFPPSQEVLEVLDDTMQQLFIPEPRKKFRDQQVGFVADFGGEGERRKQLVRATWMAEPTIANGSLDGDKRRTALFIVDDGRIFELWRHERPAQYPIPGSELPFDQQTEAAYEFRAHGESKPTWDDARALFLGAHRHLYGERK